MAYQTKKDLIEEERVAKKLRKLWDCQLHKYAGEKGPIDRIILKDNRIAGFVEIKRRNNAWHQYPDVFMSVRKVVDLLMAAEALPRPGGYLASIVAPVPNPVAAYYVWQFDDRLGFIKLTEGLWAYDVKVAGREDRGAHNDQEPLFHVPVSDIEWLETEDVVPVEEEDRDDDAAQGVFDQIQKQ